MHVYSADRTYPPAMPRRTTGSQPRDWLVDAPVSRPDGGTRRPRTFGQVFAPEWKEPSEGAEIAELAALETAKHQHELARQIRARMRDVGKTVEETAAECGMSAATLRRYLNGTNHPTIYDLHRISLVVGVPFQGGYPRRGDKSLTDAG